MFEKKLQRGLGGRVVEGGVDGNCKNGGEEEGRAEREEGEWPSYEMREEVNTCWEEEGRERDAVEDPKGDQ